MKARLCNQQEGEQLHVNGGWEETVKGKAICRWLVAWESVNTTQVAGAVAGYAGGGRFVVERFVGTIKDESARDRERANYVTQATEAC